MVVGNENIKQVDFFESGAGYHQMPSWSIVLKSRGRQRQNLIKSIAAGLCLRCFMQLVTLSVERYDHRRPLRHGTWRSGLYSKTCIITSLRNLRIRRIRMSQPGAFFFNFFQSFLPPVYTFVHNFVWETVTFCFSEWVILHMVPEYFPACSELIWQ